MSWSLRRRERRIVVTLAASSLIILAGGVVVWFNMPRAVRYRPGEQREGITDSLGRALPQDYPRVQFTDVTEAAGLVREPKDFVRSTQLPEDMGSGAAWGDYDRDGWLDLYVVSMAGPLTTSPAELAKSVAPSRLYHNRGDGTFEDVTEKAGVGLRALGMGAAWGDADTDGDLDLVVTNYGHIALYVNNGDGTFTDNSAGSGVGKPTGFWTGVSWADYDQDGDLDFYVCGYVQYTFDAADLANTTEQYGSMTPATLNPSSYPPEVNLLFSNQGDGTFAEVAQAAGVQNPQGRSLSATWSDFNADDWLDLYVANDVSDNVLYVNQRDGTFRDVSQEATVADYRGAMGLAVGDWDLDHDLDIFITHWLAQENALYVNLWTERHGDASTASTADSPVGASPVRTSPGGDGAQGMGTSASTGTGTRGAAPDLQFTDVADRYGLGQIALDFVGWGTAFLDYDLDGREDLFVVNGSTLQDPEDTRRLVPMRNHLFWNRGEDGFFEVGEVSGKVFTDMAVGRGLAAGDYDNDGDVDVVVVNNGAPPQLLRNDGGNDHQWLKVRLEGPSGGQGLGARITIDVGDEHQVRQIGAGSSYLSQNAPEAVFGLAKATQVDALHVRWPDGTQQDLAAIPAGQAVVVRQGEGWRPLTGASAVAVGGGAPPPTAAPKAGTALDRAKIQQFWATYRQAVQVMKVDGDWQKSSELFRAALALDSEHEDSLYYLGNCLIELGDYNGALDQFEHLVRVNPQSLRGFLQIGTLHALPEAGALFDLAQAEVALKTALAINPEESGSLLHLGAVRLARGHLAAASDDFAKARQLHTKAVDAYYLDGYIHWKQGDTATASTLLAKAVALSQPPTPTPGVASEGDTKRADRGALVLPKVEARRLFSQQLGQLKGKSVADADSPDALVREYSAVEAYITSLNR